MIWGLSMREQTIEREECQGQNREVLAFGTRNQSVTTFLEYKGSRLSGHRPRALAWLLSSHFLLVTVKISGILSQCRTSLKTRRWRLIINLPCGCEEVFFVMHDLCPFLSRKENNEFDWTS